MGAHSSNPKDLYFELLDGNQKHGKGLLEGEPKEPQTLSIPGQTALTEFQNARHEKTYQELKTKLENSYLDCQFVELQDIPPDIERVAFLCGNSLPYNQTKEYDQGSLYDLCEAAETLDGFGFPVYYVLNPTSEYFLTLFQCFLSQTTVQLVFVYAGQKSSEGLLFSDKSISPSILMNYIKSNKVVSQRLLFFSDSFSESPIKSLYTNSHSFPHKMIFISQEEVGKGKRKESTCGLISSCFWKELSNFPSMTAFEINDSQAEAAQSYGIQSVILSQDDTMLSLPLVFFDDK